MDITSYRANYGAASLLGVLFVLLGACGGGGGSGSDASSVNQSSDGLTGSGVWSVALTWVPPTTRGDGAVLTDLAGYRIYIGIESGFYSEVIGVSTAGLSDYVVEGLAPGTYHFVVTAYDLRGSESAPSNEVFKTVGRHIGAS